MVPNTILTLSELEGHSLTWVVWNLFGSCLKEIGYILTARIIEAIQYPFTRVGRHVCGQWFYMPHQIRNSDASNAHNSHILCKSRISQKCCNIETLFRFFTDNLKEVICDLLNRANSDDLEWPLWLLTYYIGKLFTFWLVLVSQSSKTAKSKIITKL